MVDSKYKMTISRMTVDKLGVKLYDRVSAVIAELVANGYDADATTVTIKAPMNTYLATPMNGQVQDAGFTIVVQDDGVGMTPDSINPFYLKIGSERRNDPQRGDKSQKFNRRVMGRKGVGKLAPFGICNRIEVITSGGSAMSGTDHAGQLITGGYLTAHFIMQRNEILTDEDSEYQPEIGNLDGTVQPSHGTTILMSEFIRRKVPDLKTFNRQLAHRFGVRSNDWAIKLVDTSKDDSTPTDVGDFEISTMANTRISFNGPTTGSTDTSRMSEFKVVNEQGVEMANIRAGFSHNKRFYPITGWVAYAKESYRDELMAGIRIYCRGKIAAQTSVFNRKSGFSGEYSVRSYLVGELHADWLDEAEDLIQTDRRDILWSDDLGQEFEDWGRSIVDLIGNMSREPLKKKVWDQFVETGNVITRIDETYPGEEWKAIRDTTMDLARMMGERLRHGEVTDKDYVNSLVDLSLMLGPHMQLDSSLRTAADEETSAIATIAKILKTARVAELSSYGAIAEGRVRVIEKIMKLTDQDDTAEQELQDSLTEAPWLINPLWSPISANQTLSTIRQKFEVFFKNRTGDAISLASFTESGKRPDFVLSSDDYGLQIIEIKKPHYKLTNDDWDRIQVYIDQMDAFLSDEGNEEFRKIFKRFVVTVVSDEIGLTGSQKKAFESYRFEKALDYITWNSFLLRTRTMHQEFLEEADRQKRLTIK